MNRKTSLSRDFLAESAGPGSAGLRLASIGGGVVMSLAILWGITRAQKTSVPQPAVPVEDLRAMVLESPPPPPPPAEVAEVPEPPSVMELMPIDKPEGIRISAVVTPSVPPAPAIVQSSLDLDLEALKPREDARQRSPHYVYQSTDVDQRPVVLYREIPIVTPELLRSVKVPRVTLLFVVNTDGRVENIHVLSAPSVPFGQVMVDAVEGWRFRPAVKDGRKVRCMVKLPIYVRSSSRSPFEI